MPAALLIVTGAGYSLVIGGMALVWNRIQLLREVILLIVMVFAATALPVLTVPGWFAGIGRLFPATPAVASLYGVMLGHRGITGLRGPGGMLWVSVAAAYLTAGIAASRTGEKITKALGAPWQLLARPTASQFGDRRRRA